jgi:hypothetical protein
MIAQTKVGKMTDIVDWRGHAERLREDCEFHLAEIERLRKALSANIAAALHIADVADIDVDGTVITIRKMPSGEVIAKKSWAAILGDGNAALEGK